MLKTTDGWVSTVPGCPAGMVTRAMPTTDSGGQSSRGSVPLTSASSIAILRVLGHCGTAVGFPTRPGGRSTRHVAEVAAVRAEDVPSGRVTRFIWNAVHAS